MTKDIPFFRFNLLTYIYIGGKFEFSQLIVATIKNVGNKIIYLMIDYTKYYVKCIKYYCREIFGYFFHIKN